MKWAVAVCLFLLVAVPPIPGQTPNQSTDKSRNPKSTGHAQQQPTQRITPAPRVNPESSPNPQGHRSEQKKSDDPISIKTAEPLNVRTDMPKDWMDKLNWALTGILVLVGIGGVILAIRSLRAIEGQSAYMKRQADLLEEQVGDARKANEDNAQNAARTLKSIETQAETAARQASLMEAQLQEMRESTRQSAIQLGLTERPWISPSVRIVSPLTADENGIRITLRVELANVGKSPASGIWGLPVMYLAHPSKPNVLDERKRICKEAVANPISPLGDMLFPNTIPPYVRDWTIKAPAEDVIQACTFEGTNIGSYSADIILCISYRSTIDEAARHYTGVIYHLSRFDPKSPHTIFAIPIGESVPLEQLRLQGGFPYGPIAE